MKISHILEGLKDPKDNPCWTGYHPVGTKKKNGKTVPNCVPNTNEAFDQPYNSKWEKSEFGDVDVLAKLPDGTNLSIMFNHHGDNEWEVEFHRNNSQEVTGEGDAQKIFATVLNAIQKFVKEHKPESLQFTASKEVGPGQNRQSRAKLYDKMVQRYASAMGYEAYQEDHGVGVVYELTRKQDQNVTDSLEETYDGDDFYEAYGDLWYNEDDQLDEAEYHGHKVPLGKPMQGDVKKFKVYVKNPSGNIVKVNFGDPNMRIKKSNPARRRSFRARHNCDNPGPRTKARYWSCRKW